MLRHQLITRDCITTCPVPVACSCKADQQCIQVGRDCNTCPYNTCVANPNSNNSSGGVSKGAMAGAIVGALIFFAIAIALFLRYRRLARVRKAVEAARELKPDVPAPAETVLNRPDPTEKPTPPPSALTTASVRVYSSSSNSTIDLDPHSRTTGHNSYSTARTSSQSNPFSDTHSIQTTGTEGTNVIPIALVPSEQHVRSSLVSEHSQASSTSSRPVRPSRTPDINLNLDHVNVSHESLRGATPYAQSTISNISGVSSRMSYMSNASYASDFLNEAPMIMTPSKGAVRQVVGVVKAEMVKAPGSLAPPAFTARPSVASPLAATSFGPADVVKEVDESQEAGGDPFSDVHSPTGAEFGASPPPTAHSFLDHDPAHQSTATNLATDGSHHHWSRAEDFSSRPSSVFTQAGSIIDIGSATRVNVGLGGLSPPINGNGSPRSPFRTTMGRLVTPPTGATVESLQQQQQRALDHAQAQAQAQGLDKNRRVSASSVLSAASTRADSILESFPFVPPSPISDRPIRSPPVSPLAQQAFSSTPISPLPQHTFTVAPPSPLSQTSGKDSNSPEESSESLPPPPDRRILGLSTGSQLSTASSGLGSFPFQIDSGSTSDHRPPSAFNGRQRASLDTLALTSDLSSYPLAFDRESARPPKKA